MKYFYFGLFTLPIITLYLNFNTKEPTNTFSTIRPIRSEKQEFIDRLRNTRYEFEEVIQYSNNGDYDRYVLFEAYLNCYTTFTNPCKIMDSTTIESVRILEEGQLIKGNGKLEFSYKKLRRSSKYINDNGVEAAEFGSCGYNTYENASMNKLIIYDCHCIETDELKKKIEELIQKRDYAKLSNIFLKKPIRILKFVKKNEMIDPSAIIERAFQYRNLYCQSSIVDTSTSFREEYDEFITNKYGQYNLEKMLRKHEMAESNNWQED